MKTREFHGGKGTVLYRIWADMRQRCLNASNASYPDYGARGVRICARWDSFAAFAQDMGPRPAGMSIDRENNDGDYSPDNCRWATPRQQVLNQRVRRDNKTGIRGVHFNATRSLYAVHLCVLGRNRTVGSSTDFFEACCIRKSAEVRFSTTPT